MGSLLKGEKKERTEPVGRKPTLAAALCAIVMLPSCVCSSNDRRAEEKVPVPNFARVSHELYRGGQPDREGFKWLEEQGVRTVLSLRSFHSDAPEAGGLGFERERLTMKAWHPEWKEAVAFLKISTDPELAPVYVHCLHGSDRTGTMCALYRIAVEGWDKERAIAEMTGESYGFHPIFGNLPDWIRDLDIGQLRKEAGIGDTGSIPVRVRLPDDGPHHGRP